MPVEDQPNAPFIDEASTQSKPREPVSLKRGREGSVDPSANEAFSAAHIAAKKNRLEEDAPEAHSEADEDAALQTATEPPAAPAKEGRTVGEVRRKVQEMNWKEGEPRPSEDDIVDANDDKPPAVASTPPPADEDLKDEGVDDATAAVKSDDADANDWVQVDKSEAASDDASDAPSLKRKVDEATANANAVEEKKRKSTSPTPNDTPSKPVTESDTTAPTEPPKKPQATFGSFASKPSPFASLGGASAFGAAAKTKSAFGEAASKPSAFDAVASKPNSFASSGFGSYSASFSPFAAKKKPEADDKSSSSFGDILKEKGELDSTDEKKPHLDRQDVPTGEEEEETMYQTRAKLFMMEAEGAWKERGVGLLKLNRRRQDGGGARLVMRADGVLRVIMNSALYVGMSCLEDGKHVRMTIFEAGERRFVTIRTASPKVATELVAVIHEHTPLESPKKSLSKSPSGPDDSAV